MHRVNVADINILNTFKTSSYHAINWTQLEYLTLLTLIKMDFLHGRK